MAPSGIQRLRAEMEASLSHTLFQCFYQGESIPYIFWLHNKLFFQATSAMFVSIDTVSIEDNKNGAFGMKELLDSELAKADSDAWKIVFGHYPCHSGGHYGGSKEIQEQVLPIMKAHDVDFYLTGHDHNLQHWTTRNNPSGIDHIITGTASSYIILHLTIIL